MTKTDLRNIGRFNFLYLQKQCGYFYLSIFLRLLLRRRQ